MKTSSILFPTIILFLLGLGGWYGYSYITEANNMKLTVSFTHEALETLTVVANQNKYFKEEGLEVTLFPFDTGKLALEQGLLKGKIDIATSALEPPVIQYLNGQTIQIISLMGRAHDQVKIVARKSSGISKPEDLQGKKIAVPRGSAAHFFLDQYLIVNRIDFDKVEISYINTVPELKTAIESKKVDAVAIKEPVTSAIASSLKNDGLILSPSKTAYKTYVYVVQNKTAKRRKKAVTAFLRAVMKAEKFTADNPELAMQILRDYDPQNSSEDLLRSQWEVQSLGLKLDEDLRQSINAVTEWAEGNKLITNETTPDLKPFINSTFLKVIYPEGVMIEE